MVLWRRATVWTLIIASLLLIGCGGNASDDPLTGIQPGIGEGDTGSESGTGGGGTSLPVPGSVEAIVREENLYSLTADSVSSPRTFIYRRVGPDAGGSPVERLYNYDFDHIDPGSAWVEVSAEANGYYLGPDGWVEGSGRMQDYSFHFHPDGSATLTHTGSGVRLSVSITTSSLAGQPQGGYLGDDGFLLAKDAVFPEGAEAFGFDATALGDFYHVEKWIDPIFGDSNYVTQVSIPDPDSFLGMGNITMDTLASIPVVYGLGTSNYMSNIARWTPERLEIQFGPGTDGAGEVQFFLVTEHFLTGTTYTPLDVKGTWSLVTVSGAPILKINVPPSLASTYDIPGVPFISEISADGGSAFKYGTLYPVGTPVPMPSWMNQSAYDSIMGNLDPAAFVVE